MSTTSSTVKNRYNKKTYSTWSAMIRKEEFAKIEALREKTGLSRYEFLKMLIQDKYGEEI